MAVVADDIKIYLSGAGSDGGSQSNPDAALGGYRSSSEFADAVSNNLLDDVSADERVSGKVNYRCYCIKNTNSVDTLFSPVIWVETDTGNADDDISFAVEVPTGGDTNGSAQTILDEDTEPVVGAGNISSWSDATSKVTGVGVDQGIHDVNLSAGDIVFVWVRRTVLAGTSAVDNEAVTLRVEGDN